jgi:CSLREA domain-containing protein
MSSMGLRGFCIILGAAAAFLWSSNCTQAATLTVNTTTDEYGNGTACSLREAIQAANTDTAFGGCPAGSGADTINLPAGTYTLTIANSGGTNEDNNATGDLDINASLTIHGAGSASTIIQAGTSTSNGIDKVVAANPFCNSGVNVTIDGVTVRYGRNTQPYGAFDYSFTGGGIDWCAGGAGETFTLSNAVISENTNVNGYGGGLNIDSYPGTSTANVINVTFQNNRTLSSVYEANGGAINIFGDRPTINITNSTFSSNQTTNTLSTGGALYYRPTTQGALTINNSIFSNNTAAGSGGAIATASYGTGSTFTIQNSQITNNHASGASGGGLYLNTSDVNTTPYQLSNLLISGNGAGSQGGGVYVGKANVSMANSRIVNNTATAGSGIYKSVDATTASVTNNWWGCSNGPGAAPCDRAATAGGTLTFTPWFRDQLTAITSPLVVNQSSQLTASFLTNSAGAAVPVANLSQIIGQPVSWAAAPGVLSGTQTSVQSGGTATATFTASSAGSAVISAKVDSDNISGVSSNVLNLTVNKAYTTITIMMVQPDPSVTGQSVTVSYGVYGGFGNSPTAPTGNVTVTDGTDSCIGAVAAGSCNITLTTAGARILTASYAGDANFDGSSSAGVSHAVNQAPAITSENNTTFTVGSPATFTVTTTGFPTGASMVIGETGSLPSGVTFTNNNNGTATLAGTPGAGTGGTYPITITAGNGVGANATQSFTLTVRQAPAITSANTTTFTEVQAGTFTVTTTGFPTGASMVIGETGSLPSGVTFIDNNNGTATLEGTPALGTHGSYPITITAGNGVGTNATQSFTLTINPPPSCTLTINFAGNGGNKVDSTSPDHGINCDKGSPGSGCSASYVTGTQVTLQATADWKSMFMGWSGDYISSDNPGTVTVNADKTVTATFDPVYRVKLMPNANYASIQDACDAASDPAEIRAQEYFFQEPQGVVIGAVSAKTITIKGGYQLGDTSYTTVTGMTTVQAPLTVGLGRITVDRIEVR